jgi:peptidoglycan hydrolase FlgJ
MVYQVQNSPNSINSVPLYRAGGSPAAYELGIPSDLDPGQGTLVRPPASQDSAVARRQLIDAGRQFEAYFISYLLKVMRETVPKGAITNTQGAYFHSFYDQEIGQRAAEAGGIGITRMVQEHAEKYFAASSVQPSSSGG